MKKGMTIVCVVALAVLASVTWGQVPRTISYQGVLTDGVGGAVPDGNYNMVFRLYDTSSGGAAIWTEAQSSVPVSGGIFSVTLGSVVALTATFGDTYWLTTSVAGGVETAPRRELTASPYSINAYAVQGSTNVFPADGNAGIGTTSPSAPLTVHFDNINAGLPAIAIDNNTPGGQDIIDFMNAGNAKARIRYADGGGMHIGTVVGLNLMFYTGDAVRMTIGTTGRVGIGPSGNAFEMLDVEGGIRMGTTPTTNAGTMRFTGTDFEGYNGLTWQSLTGAGGGGLPAGSAGQTLRHDGLDWVADGLLSNDGTIVNVGSATQDGFFSVYRNGSAGNVASINVNAGGGLISTFDEAGNRTAAMEPDGDGDGGRLVVYRSPGMGVGFLVDGNDSGSGEPEVTVIGSVSSARFAMGLAGNASVVLPADAIGNTEILDEAGVASDTRPTGFLLSGGVESVRFRSITAPSAGYALVMATIQAGALHTNGALTTAHFGVSDNATTFPANQDVSYEIPSSAATGDYYTSVTVHGLFQVANAGVHTFYLLAEEINGSLTAANVQLTIVFFATAYGVVTPMLTSGETNGGSPATGSLAVGDLAAERAEAAVVHQARVDRELAAMRAEIAALKAKLADD